jgi:hypothetical protein
MSGIIEWIRQNPKIVRRVFFAWIVFVIIFDLLYSRDKAHFLIDKIYLFWSIFGLAGCYLLIRVSKGLAHTILGKDENYYE